MNKVQLLGRLGKDPETRHFDDYSVTNFSVATSRKVKNKQTGEYTDTETEWHQITAWGKRGEVIAKYFHSGSEIAITGHIHYDKWEDKETGATKYSTKIILENFWFTGGSTKGEQRDHHAAPPATPAAGQPGGGSMFPTATSAPAGLAQGDGTIPLDDDIPF